MRSSFRFIFGLYLFTLLFFAGTVFVQAQAGGGLISPEDQPSTIAAATGGATSFKQLALNIVNFFLFFLGFVATVMIIYGGILYVTSGGNDEATGKAKKILLYSIVGIVVILLSFAIVNTVLTGAGTANPAAT